MRNYWARRKRKWGMEMEMWLTCALSEWENMRGSGESRSPAISSCIPRTPPTGEKAVGSPLLQFSFSSFGIIHSFTYS